MKSIDIRGARTHNLCDLDLSLPEFVLGERKDFLDNVVEIGRRELEFARAGKVLHFTDNPGCPGKAALLLDP